MRWLVLGLLALGGAAMAADVRYEPIGRQTVKLAPKPGPQAVEVLEKRTPRAQVTIGRISVTPKAGTTKEDLVAAARAKVAEVGADFLLIHGMSEPGKKRVLQASAGVYPKATLGVVFQPFEVNQSRAIVQGFRRGSKAAVAGVKVGDQIVAIQNISYQDERMLDLLLRGTPGQVVKVEVRRDETTLLLDVPLVAND